MVRSRSRKGRLCNITSVKPFYHPELSSSLIGMNGHSGAGYTFGSGVVHKFLETNGMTHILRAHQLCMEGYASLFDNHLSTVWSAPNYCYRCGNSASILEVSPGGKMYFNVFEAAPENERDGPNQQAAQNAGGKVSCQP
jgi:serine/threonine-protein phosphatase PPG1